MTEKEKAALGLLYNSNFDAELRAERIACQCKCHAYNQLSPDDLDARARLLRQIIPALGEDALIEQPFHCDLGYQIKTGHHFYANYNLVILDEAPVRIGDYVFLGPDCGIYTASHPVNARQRNEGLEYARPVTIGSHVWLGGGVRILPGVRIGSNVIIGSGSVVTKDIPDGVIAAGNPCKILREIDPSDWEPVPSSPAP